MEFKCGSGDSWTLSDYCVFFVFSQVAESKAKKMEEEINKLQKNLEQKDGQLQISSLNTEKVIIMSVTRLEKLCIF